ncbi:MAG: type IV pilus twitching motility protein PilT [Candidatus Omnitrophica bacterium]|nr:type IV pilus twitching motility protein PilT [Candidatus Omnitrophota bacterium]
MNIFDLFKLAVKENASDLHLMSNMPPVLRINGKLVRTNITPLKGEEIKQLLYQNILTEEHIARFENDLELDFSTYIPDVCRVRVNVHRQRGSIEAAFRLITYKIRTIKELGLPEVVAEFARRPDGLVLITGPTGVGKTTTLAAIIDLINSEREAIMISIEDPIEYIHKNKKSIIKQREVYSDTHSFAEALKRALRQDPNVIVVGEMRDLETIAITLTAAETGHLVLATLHTPNATSSIDRIIDVFPPHQQAQVRIEVADTLQGVISQQLLPKVDGSGRVAACEILIATPAIRNLIREGKSSEIATYMQTSQQMGMRLMDNSLKELYEKRQISYDVARIRMRHPEELERK